MAAWPTVVNVKAWMRNKQFPTDIDDVVLTEVTASATETIKAWLDSARMPIDLSCPDSVRQAVIMRAASLYVRRDSPTGVIQAGPEFVFRVNRWDADVEHLIGPYRAALVG